MSQADVPTDRPARYGKQLASHLGRRIDFTEGTDQWTAEVDGSRLLIAAAGGSLRLEVHAPDADAQARYEDVLGRHLERFGQRDELTVHWVRQD